MDDQKTMTLCSLQPSSEPRENYINTLDKVCYRLFTTTLTADDNLRNNVDKHSNESCRMDTGIPMQCSLWHFVRCVIT
jgi:hypothetical protein